jgi:hypothetical protein
MPTEPCLSENARSAIDIKLLANIEIQQNCLMVNPFSRSFDKY